jgi:ElaB/YqjD/DUF883 family membrane-anchored ribosome-binding protein
MSERSDPNLGMTTQGAIEESRKSGVEQTATSGVVSGDAGPLAAGAPMPGMTGSGGQQGGGDQQGGGQTDRVLSQVSQQTGKVSEQASAKMEAGKEKAAGGLDSLAGMVRQKGESMGGGQMQSVAATAAEKMQAGASMLRGEGGSGELTAKIESYVRSKPAESLAIAAGLGFVVAKVLK